MKFEAQKLDLDIEATGLDGKERVISPPIEQVFSAKHIEFLMAQFDKVDKELQALVDKTPEKDEEDLRLKITSTFLLAKLDMIYPGEREYFIENFDPTTIREIVVYVVAQLTGYQKK